VLKKETGEEDARPSHFKRKLKAIRHAVWRKSSMRCKGSVGAQVELLNALLGCSLPNPRNGNAETPNNRDTPPLTLVTPLPIAR
jgi:hypothetical protein